MASRKMRPPADLKPRAQDFTLDVDALKALPHFKLVEGEKQAQDLNKKLEKVEDLPGIAVLRSYQKGEVICRENEPGFTAYYIMTARDLAALSTTIRERLS